MVNEPTTVALIVYTYLNPYIRVYFALYNKTKRLSFIYLHNLPMHNPVLSFNPAL